MTATTSALRAACADALVLVPEADAYWASEHALSRVLLARKGDMLGAEAQLRSLLAWRASKQAWRYLDPAFYQEPPVIRRFFSWGFVGTDVDGYPVVHSLCVEGGTFGID